MRNYCDEDVIEWTDTFEVFQQRFSSTTVKVAFNTWIRATCSKCGNSYVSNVQALRKKDNFYCHSCALKESHIKKYGSEEYFQKIQQEKRTKTCLEKYGVSNVYQDEGVKNKIKATNIKKYGSPNGGNTKEGRKKAKETNIKKYGSLQAYYEARAERAKQTCLEHYGVPSPLKNKDILEKLKKTNIEKYGVECSLQNKEVKEKAINSLIQKYGVDNISKNPEIQKKKEETTYSHFGVRYPTQSPEVREKYIQNNLKKYGVEWGFQSKEIQEKIKNTCLTKYGYEWSCLAPEIRAKQTSFCEAEGVKFDSSWEVYVYFYFKKNNIPFEFQVPLEYYVVLNGEKSKRYYYCDFKRLDTGELIEIKNPAMLDENNNLVLLYTKDLDEQELQKRQILLEGKNQCMKENRVTLITDISFYKDWFDKNCDTIIINKL